MTTMNVYRLIPLVVTSVIILALFAVICWLAVSGDHDMRVAVISYVTGLGSGVGVAGSTSTLSKVASAQDEAETPQSGGS